MKQMSIVIRRTYRMYERQRTDPSLGVRCVTATPTPPHNTGYWYSLTE